MPRRLDSYVARMAEVAKRLRAVSLECRPGLEVIAAYGRHRDTLIYADPPYPSAQRGGSYAVEMGSTAAHQELAAALREARATVVLSGYDSPLYDRLYGGWYRTEMATSTSQGGSLAERTEVLWSNRPFRYSEVPEHAPSNESSAPCVACGRAFLRASTGRPARFCSTACRVAAHRGRPPAAPRTPVPIKPAPPQAITDPALTRHAYFADQGSIVLHADVITGLRRLVEVGLQVDTILCSPPYYGQRDYLVDGQIGLEPHPQQYLDKLVEVFTLCQQVVKDTGSLWVNLGDTYWSGKGQHRGPDGKQAARRFGLRPQDRPGDGHWARPKQLLLLPQRLGVALQETGWLARNVNVWVKPNPTPDPARDRCSVAHEYVLHFTRSRHYYFDQARVGRELPGGRVLDVWTVPPAHGRGGHRAAFSEALARLPILATTPRDGIVLDPFAGSGTTLAVARRHGFRSIGIDLSEANCADMAAALQRAATGRQQVPMSRLGRAAVRGAREVTSADARGAVS